MKKHTARFASFMAVVLSVLLVGITPALADSTVEMNRLYNPNSGEHFYTASTSERDKLVKVGWRSEGVGWVAPSYSDSPVYRVYNPNSGDHHYTLSWTEYSMLVAVGWKDEGIGWYSDDYMTVPVYRQYNPNAKSGAHNFTTSLDENNSLVAAGWLAEGIGWFACEGGSSNTPSTNVDSSKSNGGFTDAEVTSKILELKTSYPEGMPWTNDDQYTSVRYYADSATSGHGNVVHYSTGGGCAGIAYIAQDYVYGSMRTYVQDTAFDWSAIRPGDHLRTDNDGHSVVVLTKSENAITVVEGNYNGTVHWGRTITRDELANGFTYREWVV